MWWILGFDLGDACHSGKQVENVDEVEGREMLWGQP